MPPPASKYNLVVDLKIQISANVDGVTGVGNVSSLESAGSASRLVIKGSRGARKDGSHS